MNPDADLKKLERRAFLIFFRDGLWDICLGLFLVGWGVSIITDLSYLSGTFFIVLWFLVLGLKKWITYPRIGYVKTGSKEIKLKAQFAIALGVMALVGVLVFVLFSSDDRPEWLGEYIPLFFNAMLAFVVCAVASAMGVGRYYLYGILIFLAGAAHVWLDWDWAYTFIGAGGLITLVGAGILIDFLRRYSRPGEEIGAGDRE